MMRKVSCNRTNSRPKKPKLKQYQQARSPWEKDGVLYLHLSGRNKISWRRILFDRLLFKYRLQISIKGIEKHGGKYDLLAMPSSLREAGGTRDRGDTVKRIVWQWVTGRGIAGLKTRQRRHLKLECRYHNEHSTARQPVPDPATPLSASWALPSIQALWPRVVWTSSIEQSRKPQSRNSTMGDCVFYGNMFTCILLMASFSTMFPHLNQLDY